MSEMKLAVVEGHFADIVWDHAPLTTRELVDLCEQELNWKRTTTYTVLKKLCNRGIFEMNDHMVTVKISRDEFHAMQSEELVDSAFHGSLPAFVAAFATRKELSHQELEELHELIDSLDR